MGRALNTSGVAVHTHMSSLPGAVMNTFDLASPALSVSPYASGREAKERYVTDVVTYIVFSLMFLIASYAHAQSSFPETNVGASAMAQSVTMHLPQGGSVTSIEVLTLGAPSLDFAAGSTDSCSNHSFAAGGVCALAVSFAPTAPGMRQGAVVARSGSTVLGTAYIWGIGVGGLGYMSPGTMITFAGDGQWTSINDGGDPTAANLNLPQGVAFDGAGNLYIADSAHNRIRKVSAGSPRLITTIAGGDQSGYSGDGGAAADAELNVPTSVAVDGAGNLYIADSGNNVVRMIAAGTGIMTTFAGTGTAGSMGDGAAATAGQLNKPVGVTVDGSGNLYIADQKNQKIREVSAGSGYITTVAGNGATGPAGQGTFSGDNSQATAAGLGDPFAVAFDAAGNMYIPDSANNVVRKVAANGIITTVSGSYSAGAGYAGDGRAATAAQLYSPSGVLVDVAGDLIIADTQNNRIRMVSAQNGKISTVAGNGVGKYAGDDASALAAGIYGPYGMAMDGFGDLVIADYFDHRIREVPSNLAMLAYTPATRVGQRSATQEQSILNLGNSTLTLNSLTPDQNAGLNSTVTTCAATSALPVFDTCTIGAVFAPTVAGDPVQGNILAGTQQANGPLDVEESGEALALNATTIALLSNVNPSSYGQNISLIATVSAGPNTGTLAGQVTFYDGSQQLGSPITVNSGGTATLTLSTLGIGTHSIIASYGGDTVHTSSTSSALAQIVEEATQTTLVPSVNPAQLHSELTLTAVVSPTSGNLTPSGTVVFYDGALVLSTGTLDSAGKSILTTSSLAAGAHTLTASYSGASTSFILGSTSAPVSVDVQAASTIQLTSSSNPSVYGNSVQLNAAVLADNAPASSGTVQFLDNTAPLGNGTVANGNATLRLASLAAGQHAITAVYSANLNSASSTSFVLNQVVNQATTQTLVSYNPDPAIGGKATVLIASVDVTTGAGIPSGSVTFTDGATALGSSRLSGSGKASLTFQLATGAHNIVATYEGDANNGGSVSPTTSVPVIPATTTTTLSANANPITADSQLTITATVSGNGGIPGGAVTFFADSTTLGTARLDSTGVAHDSFSTLVVGMHAITAVYGGDINDATSTSAPLSESVIPIASTTTIGTATSSQTAPELILASTVVGASGPMPTGTVTFTSAGVTLGSAVLDETGVATLTPNVNSGSFSVQAQYSGDSVHAPSASSLITVTSQGVGFNIVAPSTITVATSQNTIFTVTLQSTNGFADTVGLGCARLPAMMTCHFSSASATLVANGTATVQVTVDTNAPVSGGTQASLTTKQSSLSLAGTAMPLSAIFGVLFWRGRRRTRALFLTLLLAATAICGLDGCAGMSVNSVTPGSYTVQITGAGAQSSITRVASLDVNVTR